MLFLKKPKLERFLPIPFSSIEKVCNIKCLKNKRLYATKQKDLKLLYVQALQRNGKNLVL